ncbi:MAG: hypothetical protein FWH19_01705 [Treponema sp.]|nr:hypothetical protein [Treponema sp.]
MRKFAFLTVFALLLSGTAFAQGWPWGTPPETITVEGTLQLQQGHIALSTGAAVYFVPGIARYIGFIDGLREGARISAEGFASGNFLQVSKFSIGGREYDLLADAQALGGPGWGAGYGPCPMWGAGPRGGYHHGWGHRGRGRW